MKNSGDRSRRKQGGKNRRRKKRREKENQKKKKKTKENGIVEIKRVTEEWEILDEKEKTTKSEVETKKLVPERFHK